MSAFDVAETRLAVLRQLREEIASRERLGTIRERDAATTWPAEVPGCERDRRVLLRAGDALAQMVQMQHPVSSMRGLDSEDWLVWCDGCDQPESECWAKVAIEAWNEATG